MTSEARQAFDEWVLLAPFVDEHLSLTEDEVLQKALQAVGWFEQVARNLLSAGGP